MQPDSSLLRRQTIRLAVVGFIVLALLIPLAFVDGLGDERQRYYRDVADDIAASWGPAQIVNGPYLLFRETTRYTSQDQAGKKQWHERVSDRAVLPHILDVSVSVTHQFRHRAIYDVPVYEATLKFTGKFDLANAELAKLALDWAQPKLVVGIQHTQAISKMSPLRFGSQTHSFASSTGTTWLPQGVHASLAPVQNKTAVPFEFEVTIKGTSMLSVAMIGSSTQLNMTSTWPHPSFSGQFLPASYEISDQGFSGCMAGT